MITPAIITVIYWVLSVIMVLVGLFTVITGAFNPWGGGGQVLGGLLMIVLGPIAVRIYAELLIVIFKIYENLREMNQRDGGKQDNVSVVTTEGENTSL